MGRLGHLAVTGGEERASFSCKMIERDLMRGFNPHGHIFLYHHFAECFRHLGFQYYEDLDKRFDRLKRRATKKCKVSTLPTDHMDPMRCSEMAREAGAATLEVSDKGITCSLFEVRSQDFWRDCFSTPGAPRSEMPSVRWLEKTISKHKKMIFALVKDKDHEHAPSMSSLEVAPAFSDEDSQDCLKIAKTFEWNAGKHTATGTIYDIPKCLTGYRRFTTKFNGERRTSPRTCSKLSGRNNYLLVNPGECNSAPDTKKPKDHSIAQVVVAGPKIEGRYTLKCILYSFRGSNVNEFWNVCQGKPGTETLGPYDVLDVVYVKTRP